MISEPDFVAALRERLGRLPERPGSVTGPGRSGAVASVYASYMLGVPWMPWGALSWVPPHLAPLLIVDTACLTGATLRKAERRVTGRVITAYVFVEPPRVRFWYEEAR